METETSLSGQRWLRGEAMKRETFTVYRFKGIYEHGFNEVRFKAMSMKDFIEKVASTSFERSTKDMFDFINTVYKSEEMSLEDIHKAIAEGTVFFPITVACRKKDVLEYVRKGFNVRFMRFTEYKRLLKAYEG